MWFCGKPRILGKTLELMCESGWSVGRGCTNPTLLSLLPLWAVWGACPGVGWGRGHLPSASCIWALCHTWGRQWRWGAGRGAGPHHLAVLRPSWDWAHCRVTQWGLDMPFREGFCSWKIWWEPLILGRTLELMCENGWNIEYIGNMADSSKALS